MAIVSLSSVFLRISSASSADPSKMVFNPFNVATSRCIEVTCEGGGQDLGNLRILMGIVLLRKVTVGGYIERITRHYGQGTHLSLEVLAHLCIACLIGQFGL